MHIDSYATIKTEESPIPVPHNGDLLLGAAEPAVRAGAPEEAGGAQHFAASAAERSPPDAQQTLAGS